MECRQKPKGMLFQKDSIRTIIFTYLSFQLTRMVSSLILPMGTDIVLVSVTDRPMYPSYYFEHPNAVYSYEGGFGEAMHREFIKVKNKLNITYGVMFSLNDGFKGMSSLEQVFQEILKTGSNQLSFKQGSLL